MMQELFAGYLPPIDTERLEKVMSQPNISIFTEKRDGRTVAMATLYVVELLSRRLAVVEEVVTLAAYREQGIGSGLVKRALEEAKRRGMEAVELTVREDRPDVQRFYETLGFRDRNQRAMRLCLAAR